MEEYTGPIERGMTFVWEPLKPHVTEHIKIINLERNRDDELWIIIQEWVRTSQVSGDYTGDVVLVDESRFREAVMSTTNLPDDE